MNTVIDILKPLFIGKYINIFSYKNIPGNIITSTSSNYGTWELVSTESKKIISIHCDSEYEGDNLILVFEDNSHIILGLDSEFELV